MLSTQTEPPARRIRALLALRGWGVPDLCAATGYARDTVDGHLAGRRSMTERAQGRDKGARLPLEVYAQALGVSVALLTDARPWVHLLTEPAGGERGSGTQRQRSER